MSLEWKRDGKTVHVPPISELSAHPTFTQPTEIENHIREAALKERDLIEELIEVMLTTPNSPGISVRVTTRSNPAAFETIAQLDPNVPFGEVHYFRD